MLSKNAYCVILAGGKGRRLWPCSREEKPKQFDDFFGTGRSQLQQTYDRFRALLPADHIYVITNVAYQHFVKDQLPEITSEQILAEPVHRNTLPSIAWSVFRIINQDKNASIIVSPSDHAVLDEQIFRDDVARALSLANKQDGFICMGVRPTRPEPGYGYMQEGEKQPDGLIKIKSFTEKPNREFAQLFMQSGEFYWNTGMFVARATYLTKRFDEILPNVLRDHQYSNPFTSIEEENKYMAENFSCYPNLSIERGILEPLTDAYILPCHFGWADLGTWHSIYEATHNTEGENITLDTEALFEHAKNNIVKLPHGRFAVINGLDGYIVAEQGNVLLICPKEDSSALIRKYLGEVQLRKGDQYI